MPATKKSNEEPQMWTKVKVWNQKTTALQLKATTLDESARSELFRISFVALRVNVQTEGGGVVER